MMRDGLQDTGAGVGPDGTLGIYNWNDSGQFSGSLEFKLDPMADATISGLELGISRVYGETSTIEILTRVEGGGWTSQFLSTAEDAGLKQDYDGATFYDFTFADVAADYVRLVFAGNQFGLHEVALFGQDSDAAIPLPAPVLLLGAGIAALAAAGRRRAADA